MTARKLKTDFILVTESDGQDYLINPSHIVTANDTGSNHTEVFLAEGTMMTLRCCFKEFIRAMKPYWTHLEPD